MIRNPIALIPYIILAAVLASAALWELPENSAAVSILQSVGGPFHLEDQNGVARSQADFRGHDTLLYFGYTNCPDVCPTTLAAIADAMKQLGPKAARLTPVFVTVDPQRDTPAVLKNYLASFGPQFVGLTGTLKNIRQIAGEYRVYFKKVPLKNGGYAMNHSSVLYLLGPNVKLIAFYDANTDSKTLAGDLVKRL